MDQKPILVIAYDLLGPAHAGPALRTLALSRELGKLAPVTVIYEGEEPVGDFDNISFLHRDTVVPDLQFFARFRSVLAPPLVAMVLPEVLDTDLPLVVDLFDPVVWENLELYRNEPEGERGFQHERHLAALLGGLFRADFFLVAGERQKDLFTGALMSLNRLNPSTWIPGLGPDQMIGLVPFGLPDEEPPSSDELQLPGVFNVDGPLVVWGGGLWDWLKPDTVVKSFKTVLDKFPDAILAFPGTKHPNPHVGEPSSLKLVRKAGKDLGLEGSVIYSDWLPRNEYLALLAHARCGVSAHTPGLESRYAVRTRFLDAFWMGLPMVVSAGDEYSDYIARENLGVVVGETHPEAFGKAIVRVLESGRGAYAGNFGRVRSELRWSQLADPLLDWMASPRLTHGKGADFFREVGGEGVARDRPSDPRSLLRRAINKLRK